MADQPAYQSQDEIYGGLLSNLLNPPPDQPSSGAMPQAPASNAAQAIRAGAQAAGQAIQTPPPAQPKPAATPNAVTPSGNGPTAGTPQKSWADYVRQANDSSTQALDSATAATNRMASQPGAVEQNAPLEQRRQALAAPIPYRDPQTGKVMTSAVDPETGETIDPSKLYKPGIGTRIVRGIDAVRRGGVLGAFDPKDVGGTAYGDPNRNYQQAEQIRQQQAGSIRQQEDRNIADEKADSERLGKIGTEQRAVATGYQDVAKDSTAQQNAEQKGTSANATMLTNMGKAGLKPQFDGQGNIIGVEDNPDSEAFKGRQVMNDLRSAQTQAAEANAELKRAQNDPNSPAYKMAQQRAFTANMNANAATTRAQAYILNATAGNLGTTPEGKQIEGSVSSAEGTPIGSRFSNLYSKNQSNVAQFNDVLGATDNIEKTAGALIKAGGKLNSPAVATAIADPKSTSVQWAQGEFVNSGLTPEERDYVTNVKAYKENLQALRKSAGGGVSDAQVNRLMEMAPGASTPDIDYLKRQTSQIRQTANRLSEGIPSVKGGNQVQTPAKTGTGAAPPKAVVDGAKVGQYLHGPNGESYQKKEDGLYDTKTGKKVEVK